MEIRRDEDKELVKLIMLVSSVVFAFILFVFLGDTIPAEILIVPGIAITLVFTGILYFMARVLFKKLANYNPLLVYSIFYSLGLLVLFTIFLMSSVGK